MALALVFAFGFVADVAAFERVREIDKWAKEIDAIVQQLADTYLGDNEFLKRVMESCSFLEDDSDGLEIAERAARELGTVFSITTLVAATFKFNFYWTCVLRFRVSVGYTR